MAVSRPLLVWATVLASTLFTVVFGQETTACSPPRRVDDLGACLSGIRQGATNMSLFWFGSGYQARCPPQRMFTIDCFNNLKGIHSLASLVFGNDTDLSKINRYIEVNFTSPAGTYEACDFNYKQESAKMFSIDPLSATAYRPWGLRMAPSIRWMSNDKEYFTLFVVDVPNRFIHGVFVNIPGSDMSNAEVLKPYHGPRNSRNIHNPYAFVLYQQGEPFNTSPRYLELIRTRQIFSIPAFAREHNLRGPVGLSWMLAADDAYAIGLQRQAGIINNCASLVSEAYSAHKKRPFLERNPNLSVFIRLRFSTDQLDMPCGNEWKCFRNDSFYADPIGNVIYAPGKTRTGARIDITLSMNKLFPNNTVDFAGQIYTMLAVDPDIPMGRSAGNNERPLVHWLVTNMPADGGKLGMGEVIHPYWGPGPPDPPPHTYYFLLYEQMGELQIENTDQFTEGCSGRLAGRCKFDVNMFARTYNLTLVGASWILAQNDRDDFLKCRGMSTPPPSTNKGKCATITETTQPPEPTEPTDHTDPVGGAPVVHALRRTLAVSLVLLFIIHSHDLFILLTVCRKRSGVTIYLV